MIYLDSTIRKLQAVLSSAANTTQPVATVCYYDVRNRDRPIQSLEYLGVTQRTVLNDTTQVDICAVPGEDVTRNIVSIHIPNRSVDTEIVTVSIYDGTNRYPLIIQELRANEALFYEDGHGWYLVQASTGGGGTTTGFPFSLTLTENYPIILPVPLTADGKFTGLAVAGVLGETVAFGEVVYKKAADSQFYLADASTEATSGSRFLGVCVLAGGDNAVTQILLPPGFVRADALYPTFTVGDKIYLSLTPGAVTQTQPATTTDEVDKVLGSAWDANTMFFYYEPGHQTHI